MKPRMRVGAGLAAAALLAACASAPAPRTPEEAVQQRAQQRWDALLEKDVESAYGFFSPGQRSATSLEAYQRELLLSRVRWQGARVAGAACEEDACEVKVDLTVLLASPVPGVRNYEITRPITERWILAQNQWWYVPR